MRIVIQRVRKASVSVDSKVVGAIGHGMVLLVAVHNNDSEAVLHYLADKCINLRIFEDENQKMNLSALDINAEILVISQFTLYGDCSKGRRPSFVYAAPAEIGEQRYDRFVEILRQSKLKVETGKFQAKMMVEIHNDGPVTFILER